MPREYTGWAIGYFSSIVIFFLLVWLDYREENKDEEKLP